MNADTILLVTNRSSHTVAYPIPETEGRWRTFAAGETKKLPFNEIEAACQIDGCKALFNRYLLIDNAEAAEAAMNIKPEPEYFMTSEQVKKWLPACSLDELLDALDFAPDGVLTLIKKYAVELPLNDMNKCNAIKEKLKFDVLKAIELDKISKEDTPKVEEKKERRVTLVTKTEEPTRRVNIKLSDEK